LQPHFVFYMQRPLICSSLSLARMFSHPVSTAIYPLALSRLAIRAIGFPRSIDQVRNSSPG
jgi:hypothetical protein